MSKKIIGIKQADGSFFPILKDGEPANKTLELTTVRDGQTAVKINLYKQYEDTSDLEYVDTLLIENLVPHLKEEPSFSLSINLDEDNVLTAEVLDPETGAKSDTEVSLVTLSEAQQGDSTDFALADDSDIFDDIAVTNVGLEDDFSSLASFEEEDIVDTNALDNEEKSIEDTVITEDDLSFTDGESISDDFSMDTEEDFEFPDNRTLIDDTSLDIESFNDDFSFADDEVEQTEEETAETTEESFDLDDPDFSFDDSSLSEDFSTNELDSFDTDSLDLNIDSSSAETDSIQEDTTATSETSFDMDDDDFSFPESAALHDDFNPPDADFATSTTSLEDDISSDSLDMGDDFGEIDSTQEMSLDGLSTDTFEMDDDTFSSDSLDLGDDFSNEAIDFDSDFDLGSSESISMTDNESEMAFDNDIDVGFGPDEDSNFSDTVFDDDVQYAEYGEQNTKTESSTSFIPPLYDKKFKEDIEKRRTRKKYSIPMIVCIICALVCIAAVVMAFIFGNWPGDNAGVVNNIVTVEPPQVFEKEQQEKMNEGIVTNPPVPEENTIEVVIEEEVVPVKPEPAPEAKVENIEYLLRWGDTLWDLSDTYYRNPWLYDTIADANGIKDPDYIIAGTYISIPPR